MPHEYGYPSWFAIMRPGRRHVRSQMSYRSKHELLSQVAARYQLASHGQKSAMLDVFVAATGYARKYAIRVLTRPPLPAPTQIRRPRLPRYGAAVHAALEVAWPPSTSSGPNAWCYSDRTSAACEILNDSASSRTLREPAQRRQTGASVAGQAPRSDDRRKEAQRTRRGGQPRTGRGWLAVPPLIGG